MHVFKVCKDKRKEHKQDNDRIDATRLAQCPQPPSKQEVKQEN